PGRWGREWHGRGGRSRRLSPARSIPERPRSISANAKVPSCNQSNAQSVFHAKWLPIRVKKTRQTITRGVLARRLRRANRGQGLHGDIRRGDVVIRHEEIRHQGYGFIDPVVIKIPDAAGIEHLVIDAELSGEVAG